jgi:hypothetical protein
VAQGAAPDADGDYPGTYLLLTLHAAHFNDLAIFGSEIEDLEDSHDREATPDDDGEEDRSDDEPSTEYGACMTPGMEECEEASYPFGAKDQAIIAAARERYNKPPGPARFGVLTYATVDPEP